MKIKLKKIKYDAFDDVIEKVTNDCIINNQISIDTKYIESNSENVLVDGEEIICDFDITKYESISSSKENKYLKEAKISMLLYKEFVDVDGKEIPRNIYFTKEVWAYLSLITFRKVVTDLKIYKDNINYGVISRVFFSVGSFSKIDRTCLMFYWIFMDMLKSQDEQEITNTAFEFIDPVKAIFERMNMSMNKGLLRAYVEAIIKIGKPALLKSNKYRSYIPSNLSCYYAATTFDSMEYNEMVDTIAEQLNEIIRYNN